ncbi:MAG: S9 family peptidase [Bradymonadales bacterium]|nr:S9 family peptidase [Bradymonadales bacterium]
MAATRKRPITAEDLYRIPLLQDCQISPDGKYVAYGLQRIDRKTEKRYANLWIVPTGRGRPRQFTYGDQVDRMPRWSPDGSEIAFLSNRGDEKQFQLYVIPLSGGEARPVTDLKGSFANVAWSPAGRTLAFQFRKKDEEELKREKDEQKKKLGVVSRHIDRVFYKLDGVGFLPKERWHLWTVDSRTGRTSQLTEGAIHDEVDPSWFPDGSRIVFCSNRTPQPDLDPDAVDLFVMPARKGEMVRIEAPLGFKAFPVFSPDGGRIAYLGLEGRGDWWRNNSLWVVPTDGSDAARNLTGAMDLHVDSVTLNDLGAPPMVPPVWSIDGSRLTFQVSRHGSTRLWSVAAIGQEAPVMLEGREGGIGPFTLDEKQRRMAFFQGTVTDPGSLYLLDRASGKTSRLVSPAEGLLRAIDLGECEEVWLKGAAGNDLQGWILKPPGFDPAKRYPSILEIHGGPQCQYGHLFMHEFYFLAAHGYVVHFTNPRGGQGYGEEYCHAIWGAWGTVDYDDLMAWTDQIEKLPYIDPGRMGVTGGSYGGFMTNWIIGHTNRFKAAVTQRCVSNIISMWGSSDFNWVFQEEFDNLPPWEGFERMWRCSPMQAMGNARTPTLVIHSLNDLRCAVEQGEQIYVALKKLGVESELVLFPEEPHGLSREGRTDRRIVRLNHILRWFDRFLTG